MFGTVGRSESATDNAPLDMYDTTVMLKPREQWPAGMTYEKLIQEMDAKLQFPGLSNTWTMPVENRLDMELTGIKTPLGMKVQGPNVEGIEQAGVTDSEFLSGHAGDAVDLCGAVAQGFYVNVEVNRAEAARYGLTRRRCADGGCSPVSAARTLRRTSRAASGIPSMFAISRTFETMSSRCERC